MDDIRPVLRSNASLNLAFKKANGSDVPIEMTLEWESVGTYLTKVSLTEGYRPFVGLSLHCPQPQSSDNWQALIIENIGRDQEKENELEFNTLLSSPGEELKVRMWIAFESDFEAIHAEFLHNDELVYKLIVKLDNPAEEDLNHLHYELSHRGMLIMYQTISAVEVLHE